MRRNIIKHAIFALTIVALAIFAYSGTAALADEATYTFASSSGLNTAGRVGGYAIGGESTSVQEIISNVIFAALGLVGVVFLGFVMYGAFIWMTSLGNEEKIKKANKTIMSALIGLIITLSAYVASYFLISYLWP